MSSFDSLATIDQHALDAVPAAVYVCAADGVILRFNRRAAELWGRSPRIGDTDERFCGAFRLHMLDGSPLPHAQTPMAEALRTGEPQRDKEAIIERPDGSRIVVLINIDALKGPDGSVQGAINSFQDITERNRAEAATRMLAAIVASSEDAIISKDLNGCISTWNSSAERLFGYSAEEAIGKSITLLYPPDCSDEDDRILERIGMGQEITGHETVRRRKDGTDIDVSLTISPIRDRRGNIIGASKIVRDISERKKADDALSQRIAEQTALYDLSERLLRAETAEDINIAGLDAIQRALNCDRASILLFDHQGIMRFVAWNGLSGAYRQAVDGHSPWPPDSSYPSPIFVEDVGVADFPDSLKEVVFAEGIRSLAFIPLVAHGKLIGKFMIYFNSVHRYSSAEQTVAMIIARQLGFGISRHRAEKDLLESEARGRVRAAELQAIMDAVPAMIWIARDKNCKTIDGNRAFYDFLGLYPEETPSLTAPFAAHTRDPEIRSNGRRLRRDEFPLQRAARGETLSGFETEHRSDNGSVRYLLGNARPLLDTLGNPNGAVAAFVDITDRKRMEQQRDLLVAELSHRVKNTLATVMSIARQSFANPVSYEEALNSFDARIRALAQTHSRLAERHWTGVAFDTMLNDELAPYEGTETNNVRLSGPQIVVSAKCALTLGMTFHELATNAAKYGAFSTGEGTVSVDWQILQSAPQLRIQWTESGGPAVSPPTRSGFGRLLLERALAFDLKGEVAMNFAADGLRCTITIPCDDHILAAP